MRYYTGDLRELSDEFYRELEKASKLSKSKDRVCPKCWDVLFDCSFDRLKEHYLDCDELDDGKLYDENYIKRLMKK